jgi:uncharacterized protein YndB with AHSA1/START domain
VTESAATYLSDGAIELTRRIEAPPETVFRYFTDPERYRSWLGVDAELDASVGGDYRIQMTDNGGISARGRYVVLDPPQRLVFTWGFDGLDGLPPGSSTVEVTLTRDRDATIVRLRHSELPGAESCDFHAWGWGIGLDRLVIAATGGDPGAYPHAEL